VKWRFWGANSWNTTGEQAVLQFYIKYTGFRCLCDICACTNFKTQILKYSSCVICVLKFV
jgi:hypothetical protein